jgi:peptidoglycan/LPS O-acetylase OafA/YrhL
VARGEIAATLGATGVTDITTAKAIRRGTRTGYYGSIDAIRFLSAFAVLLHHAVGRPAFLLLGGWTWAADIAGSLWFGRSAVMVFFLISGFCVHGPNLRSDDFDVVRFLTRRYVRLLIPFAVILLIAGAVGVSYHPYHGWITWSLICEFAYYTSYPVLRILWQRFGWPVTILASYVAGYAVLAVSWIEADVENTALMIATDVLSCLPVWLLGCWLVEVVSTGRKLVFDHLAVWRCVIVLASLTIGLLHYRAVVGLELTGPIYGAVAVPWLWAEISHDRNYPVVTKWGQWSYSLYLVHPAAFFGSRPLLVALHVPGPLLTPVGILVALVCAYLFYLAVERPSHRLARALSARRPDLGADHAQASLAKGAAAANPVRFE